MANDAWADRARRVLGCLALSTSCWLGAQAQDDHPTFRTAVDLTVVELTVRGQDGRLLTDLQRSDFQVTQRRRAVPVEQFSLDRQPVTAALMIQTRGDLPAHRNIAQAFVETLSSGDRLTIGSYGLEVAVSPLLTADARILRRVLDEELWYGRFLPVATAVHRGALALPLQAARPTVILIGTQASSDCYRPWACVDVSKARETVRARGAAVYGIVTGLGSVIGNRDVPVDVWESRTQRSELVDGPFIQLAKDAGGYLKTREIPLSAWPQLAREVLDELRLRYVIGFTTEVAGSASELDIRVSRRDATVQLRKTRGGLPR